MNLFRCPSDWITLIAVSSGMVIGSGTALAQTRPMGTDVSSFQPTINWSSMRTDGLSFAWTKATEGTYYQDAYFVSHVNGAKAAGVLIGAYHFARPGYDPNITGANSADTEAQYFWNFAGSYVVAGGGYLVPMLDWEDTNVLGKGFTAATLSQWANEWCNDVSNYAHAAGVTIKPVIYTGSWYSEPGTYPGLNSTVTIWPSWISDYPSCTGSACGSSCPQTCAPGNTYPWSSWNIWQYGDTNWSGGDSDVFNGTTNQFIQMFVVGNTNAPTPYAPAGATVYWDPGAKKASPGTGGTGSWDTSTTNWWYSGTSNVVYSPSGDYATFAGTNGTVTLATSLSADGLTFSTSGYTVSGAGTLTLNSPGTISVPAGTPTYIDCVLGGVAFTLSGGGILVLNNGANYSGGQTVNGPNTTLVVVTDHDAGNDGVTLNLENGGIYQDNDTTSGDQFLLPGSAVALLIGGGIFDNPNANLTMSNYITGAGSLTTIGTTYTLTLTDTGNNYSGGTIVQSGTLRANGAGVLGSTSAPLTVSGGTLDLGGAGHTAGTVTISSGTLQDGTLTGTSYAMQGGTASAILAGSGGVTKTTTNTATLSGANVYTGITTITSGLLQVSSDANLGAAPSSPVTNKLTLNNGGIASGLRCTAGFTINANRGITLVGPNGGSIQATSGQTVTYPGIITGSGNFGAGSGVSLGYGVVILSGANNYKGTTTIAAGTLRLGANGTLPAGTPLTVAADNNTGGGGIFDMNGRSQTIGPLASSTGIGGVGADTPTIKLTGALTILQTNVNTMFSGVIIGSGGSLTLGGAGTLGTLTLSGTNTYTGNTTINAGTLALASTGSINSSPLISIAAGATFDVSAISSFALGIGSSLSASGALLPATIKGSNTVNLGAYSIILAYDGSHPALTISQGVLSLNGNPFIINGSPLSPGAYTVIQQASGNIASSGSNSVTGTAIPAAATGAISVSGGNVILTITDSTTTTLNSLTPSTYGQPVTFTANVAPAPAGGTVQFYDSGVPLGSAMTLSNGTASYTTNGLSVGYHPITASYSGALGYAASTTSISSTQMVTLPPNSVPVTITGVTLQGNGAVQMNFSGVPGYTYWVEAATSLDSPVSWIILSTNVADINGLFYFTDLGATNYSDLYYRTAVSQ